MAREQADVVSAQHGIRELAEVSIRCATIGAFDRMERGMSFVLTLEALIRDVICAEHDDDITTAPSWGPLSSMVMAHRSCARYRALTAIVDRGPVTVTALTTALQLVQDETSNERDGIAQHLSQALGVTQQPVGQVGHPEWVSPHSRGCGR